MFTKLLNKLFGSSNQRVLKSFDGVVQKINTYEAEFAGLNDPGLQGKTAEFKQRLDSGETLDDLLPEAFAVVREAAKRVLGMRPYDVQMLGGIILHKGMVAEMATGEGKTLVATLPSYLNALTGRGVHIVTVNDYLAKRDAAWMGKVHEFLGLSVGSIVANMEDHLRQAAYECDITYATNNELGFDYLRDNMKFRAEDLVHRGYPYAIVDEVDSILIDEARTPLIISGPADDSSDLYAAVNCIMPKLVPEDYETEEKNKSVTLTEAGNSHVEELLKEANLITGDNLYEVQNISLVHHVNQALKAHLMFHKDIDYIVKDDSIILIDEFTGRMMQGRRFSDGLHQALEAKEGVTVQNENQTLASVTFQNYFRMYDKLAGMTGTAATEAAELEDIYNLKVVQVPTNLPLARKDHDDQVYRTEREKIDAITALVQECTQRKQPVLIGTVSIEKSEQLSAHLAKAGIAHSILNARQHQKEAFIVAQAGRPGAVTIATNMAGRGTDIKLGGNVEMLAEERIGAEASPEEYAAQLKAIEEEVAAAREEVKQAGGLFVIGTERHESRRVDNQLRGRSGRQGDPGASQFFLALEDDLMRIFGSDRLDSMLQKLGLQEGEVITHPWVNKALERAQQKVEARNYDIRKHLLKYDDVMNNQRQVVYQQRHQLMVDTEVTSLIKEMQESVIADIVQQYMPPGSYADDWDLEGLHEETLRLLGMSLPYRAWSEEEGVAEAEVQERIETAYATHMAEKDTRFGAELMRMAEKSILLRVLDSCWKDHLHAMDHLRQGINLRAYGQRDPLNEYKQEAYALFEGFMVRIRQMTVGYLSHLEIGAENEEDVQEQALQDAENRPQNFEYYSGNEASESAALSGPKHKNPGESMRDRVHKVKRKRHTKHESRDGKANAPGPEGQPAGSYEQAEGGVARNAPCPCGSGQRYKHCCGALGGKENV